MSVKEVSIPKTIIMKQTYKESLPLEIVWHICERQSCANIMIYSRIGKENCTAHIQTLKKNYFLPCF